MYLQGAALVTLPSGSHKLLSIFSSCLLNAHMCSVRSQYLIYQNRFSKFKASSSLELGFRPSVRGVAKNPVDHPHGGRTKSIRFPRTPWGKPTKLK